MVVMAVARTRPSVAAARRRYAAAQIRHDARRREERARAAAHRARLEAEGNWPPTADDFDLDELLAPLDGYVSPSRRARRTRHERRRLGRMGRQYTYETADSRRAALSRLVAWHHELPPEAARRAYDQRARAEGGMNAAEVEAQLSEGVTAEAVWRHEGAVQARLLFVDHAGHTASHHAEAAERTTPTTRSVAMARLESLGQHHAEATATLAALQRSDHPPPNRVLTLTLTRAILTAAPPAHHAGQGAAALSLAA